jgi:hypothetical protein
MGKYDIAALTRSFFPWFWQNQDNLALVDVLQSVFDNVNELYEDSEQDFTERVGYSIQRLSLESGLNDRFDPTLRRITVVLGVIEANEFVFNEGEVLPVGQDEKFIFNEGETIPGSASEIYFYNNGEFASISTAPFTVNCPLDIQGQEQEIRAFIEAVLIAATEYTLIFA